MWLLRRCQHRLRGLVVRGRQTRGAALWSRPVVTHLAGTGPDLARTRRQLLAENALLRQQLLVLHRSVKRPILTPTDRALLVFLAGRARAWRHALLLVQPQTLLRWHRTGFRALWRRKARPHAPRVRRLLQPGTAAPGPWPRETRAVISGGRASPGVNTRGAGPGRLASCLPARRVGSADAFSANTAGIPGPRWPPPRVSARRVVPTDRRSGQDRGTVTLSFD